LKDRYVCFESFEVCLLAFTGGDRLIEIIADVFPRTGAVSQRVPQEIGTGEIGWAAPLTEIDLFVAPDFAFALICGIDLCAVVAAIVKSLLELSGPCGMVSSIGSGSAPLALRSGVPWLSGRFHLPRQLHRSLSTSVRQASTPILQLVLSPVLQWTALLTCHPASGLSLQLPPCLSTFHPGPIPNSEKHSPNSPGKISN